MLKNEIKKQMSKHCPRCQSVVFPAVLHKPAAARDVLYARASKYKDAPLRSRLKGPVRVPECHLFLEALKRQGGPWIIGQGPQGL